jgi:hypothetical protein
MGLAVVEGATIRCTMGTADSTLIGATGLFKVGSNYAATIDDHRGPMNLGTFFMCKNTKQLCTPITPAPWVGACSSINTGNVPLLSSGATLNCVNCGTISIVDAGQSTMATETLDPAPPDTHKGLFGPLHDALGFVADLPVPTGPVGAYAGIIDAHVYNLQGDKAEARAKWWGAAANLVPLKKLKVVDGAVAKVLPKDLPKVPKLGFGEAVHDSAGKVASADRLMHIKKARAYLDQQERVHRAADWEEAIGQNALGQVAEDASKKSEPGKDDRDK